MRRAWARNLIDFTQVDINSSNWWQRCIAVTRELERQDDVSLTYAQLHYNLAVVSNGSVTDETLKKSRKNAYSNIITLLKHMYPWQDAEKYNEDTKDELMELYKREVGDMNDPEFAEKVRKAAEYMLRPIEEPVTAAQLRKAHEAAVKKAAEKSSITKWV